MTTDMVNQSTAANRPGGAVNDPHQAQPWDFGAWTNPAIGGPVVWVTGVVLHMFDIDWYWPLLAGLGLPHRSTPQPGHGDFGDWCGVHGGVITGRHRMAHLCHTGSDV